MDYWITKIFHLLAILVGAYSQEVFNTMPPPVNTNFSCRGRDTGFYADIETNCRVYHMCDDHGNKFTYYCPAETAFRQEALVCDHAHLVDCAKGRRFGESLTNDEIRNEKIDEAESTIDRKSLLGDSKNPAGRSFDVFQSANSNPAYTRSFRITADPQSEFSTPKSLTRKQPTFVLSSSVFLRDRANYQKISSDSTNNRVAMETTKNFENSDYERGFFSKSFSTVSTTTFRPFGADFKANGNFKDSNFRSRNTDKDDRMDGFFERFTTSSTTLKPSQRQFKVTKLILPEETNNETSGGKFDSSTTTTTFRPFGAGFKVKGINVDRSNAGKTKFEYENDGIKDKDNGSRKRTDNEENLQFEDKKSEENFEHRGFVKNIGKSEISEKERPAFVFDGSNFPYSETLRSMQTGIDQSETSLRSDSSTAKPTVPKTTAVPIVTAGTEFPIHAFTGSLSPLLPNELEDDPYYPKRSTTTEIYYKLSDREKEGNKPFRFSTGRPWPGSLDFEIPEVLPDLNTLDDLVDRRKLFYIPRVKAI